MKASCRATDSAYNCVGSVLGISRHTGLEESWSSGRFTLLGDEVGGGETIGAGFVESGRVVSRVDIGMPSEPSTSVMPFDYVLASNPMLVGYLDPDKSGFVLSVDSVERPYRIFAWRRSGKTFERSGIFSKDVGVIQRIGFCLTKSICIFFRIFFILAE